MKKLLLLIVMLISINASSQWNWQNPYPTNKDFYSVSFINSQTGWAAGYKGTLAKSTDGGNKWNLIYSLPEMNVYSIKFFNAYTGYITGSALLKSTNGGLNWTQLTIPITDVKKSFFLNVNTGWIGTCSGAGLENKRRRCALETIAGFNTQVNDIYFTNNMTGWVVSGLGLIYKSSDGGTEWSFQKGGATKDLNSVYFIDANTGWIVGDGGTLLSTKNGGEDWNYQTISSSDLKSLTFIDFKTGWAAGSNGKILKTTNGRDWFAQVSNDNHNLQSVNFISESVGYAVGLNGSIIKTADGGSNWVNLAYATTSFLQSVHFANNFTGWTVGSDGAIFKSTNSGEKWIQQGIYTNFTYRGVRAVSTSTAWIVGDSGKIIRTTNGGVNWSNQQSGTTANLNSVFFWNSYTGWITGEGVILKTTNGGTNWIPKNGIQEYTGRCIFFIDNNTGWIATSGIYKTTDGGETWNMKSKFNGKSISFVNSLTGYAVGGPSFIKSVDGGETWSGDAYYNEINGNNIEDSPPESLTSVSFVDEKTGWYTQNHSLECQVMRLFGNAINKVISTDHNSLTCVYATSTGYVWAVGESGTIVNTTNGGLSFNNGNVYETPSVFVLHQNYPNPFNPITTITYEIPKFSAVKVIVYDIMGREIAVLLNEHKKAGSYEIHWDGTKYSSGIYLYRIQAGDFSETKRMLLIK